MAGVNREIKVGDTYYYLGWVSCDYSIFLKRGVVERLEPFKVYLKDVYYRANNNWFQDTGPDETYIWGLYIEPTYSAFSYYRGLSLFDIKIDPISGSLKGKVELSNSTISCEYTWGLIKLFQDTVDKRLGVR